MIGRSYGDAKRGRTFGVKRDAKGLPEAPLAARGNLERARVADARDPAERETAAGKGDTDRMNGGAVDGQCADF